MNNTNAADTTLSPRAALRLATFRVAIATQRANHRAAIAAIAELLEGTTTVVTFEGEGEGDDERVVFTSTTTGTHSLSVTETDGERFVGHLEGFLSSQPDTKGEWFKLRMLAPEQRDSECPPDCDACMAALTHMRGYYVATDFGSFCTLGCAIGEREAAAENAHA